MRVYVVVGVFGECIEDVEVFSEIENARKFKQEIDQDYAANQENDSVIYKCETDKIGGIIMEYNREN